MSGVMSNAHIEVTELSYAYPDSTKALHGISFTIKHGEAVGLIGANGAGKSTLLLHLNGFYTANAGRIRLGDLELSPTTLAAARRAVGLVFQNPDDQLFMPTVGEDVAFGPLYADWPTARINTAVATALERVGMAHLIHRPPYRLSAGEKRAVAIAAVLATEPDTLVMDEPSSNLDPRARRRLIDLLRSFQHTRIIATHDLELVVEVCTRVIVLDAGRIVATGPTRDILSNESLMLAHGLESPHILKHRHPH
jgi:cobalt/nickel transport system ATP-binding protein